MRKWDEGKAYRGRQRDSVSGLREGGDDRVGILEIRRWERNNGAIFLGGMLVRVLPKRLEGQGGASSETYKPSESAAQIGRRG